MKNRSKVQNLLIRFIILISLVPFVIVALAAYFTMSSVIPKNELASSSSAYFQIIGLIGIGIIILSILLGMSFIKKISKPLNNLMTIIKEISAGDFSKRVNAEKFNNYEIHSIASGIN